MADTYTRVKDIIVNITAAAVSGAVGLGIPLVISGKAEKAVEYKEVANLADVAAAGFASTTDVYKNCAAIFSQNNRPAKIAVCATTDTVAAWLTANYDKDFRQIIPVLGAEDSTLAEIATAVNTLDNKMLFIAVETTDELPTIQSDKVVAIVYGGKSECVNAAVVGATAGLAVGSFTYKNIKLVGVEAEDKSVTEVDAIHEAGAICILKKAGDIVTSEGKTTSGEYIDVVDSKDYIVINIAYKAQKLLNDSPKLTFDNVGISQLENVVTDVLASAYGLGIIATNEDGTAAYSTSFATREQTSETDRADRHYKGGNFSFDLAGAIHMATINGTLNI